MSTISVHLCYMTVILFFTGLHVRFSSVKEPQERTLPGPESSTVTERYCLICNSFLRNEGRACAQGDSKFSEKCIDFEEFCFTAKGVVGNERVIERGCINQSLMSGSECKNLILDSQYQKMIPSRVCSCDSDNCNSEDLLQDTAQKSLAFKIMDFAHSVFVS